MSILYVGSLNSKEGTRWKINMIARIKDYRYHIKIHKRKEAASI